MEPVRYLSTREVAKILKVSHKYVNKLIRSGRLYAKRSPSGSWLIFEPDLLDRYFPGTGEDEAKDGIFELANLLDRASETPFLPDGRRFSDLVRTMGALKGYLHTIQTPESRKVIPSFQSLYFKSIGDKI